LGLPSHIENGKKHASEKKKENFPEATAGFEHPHRDSNTSMKVYIPNWHRQSSLSMLVGGFNHLEKY
jgi:hypothetical protein